MGSMKRRLIGKVPQEARDTKKIVAVLAGKLALRLFTEECQLRAQFPLLIRSPPTIIHHWRNLFRTSFLRKVREVLAMSEANLTVGLNDVGSKAWRRSWSGS